jgi:hypothetical protein
VLKTVVEQMHTSLRRVAFGHQSGFIPLGGDVNRDLVLARDEQRLVAEFLCCPSGVNQKWKRGAAPAVAT